ncbi:hypothetical protein AGMMS50293_15840 [Spirochaetia bacterium]|nr:hypothetical protein AGMMS50293_15840 [Spirochaetia bacterium]
MIKARPTVFAIAALFVFVSCSNPMVNHLLGEIEKEKVRENVALWAGEWFHSLAEAIDAADDGTAVAPSEIFIRKDITTSSDMGGNGINLPAGKHISLKPYLPDTASVLIMRKPNGAALFTVEDGASLILDGLVIISGDGGARGVYVSASGTFTLRENAQVIDTDVYLKTGAKITLDGPLLEKPVAQITPEIYPNPDLPLPIPVQVLDGTLGDINGSHTQFDVTPEPVSAWDGELRHWCIDSAGYLKHIVASRIAFGQKIYYTDLQLALNEAYGGPDNLDEVTLLSNINLDANGLYKIDIGHYVRLTVPENSSYSLRRTEPTSKNIITVAAISAQLELTAPPDSEIILDGGAIWSSNPAQGGTNTSSITSTQAIVYVDGGSYMFGTLRLGNGAVIRNNDRIPGNGSGVEIRGDFYMDGGVITRNRTASNGGGIYIWGDNTHTADRIISGGSITENDSSLSGGGVMLDLYGSSRLTMTGGLISGNRANGKDGLQVSSAFTGYGGGIFIPGNNTYNAFYMQGGTISNNTSKSGVGNGVALDRIISPSPEFTLSGDAQITDNDVHLRYHPGMQFAATPYITVSGAMTVSTPVLITMQTYPASGSSRLVFGGPDFSPDKFTVLAPYQILVDGRIKTP